MTTIRSFRPEMLPALLQDLATQGIPGEMCVRGSSMRPFLVPGDRLRVVPATADDVRVGSVVVWLGDAGPITHRLVGRWRARDNWWILTKGDASPRLDAPLPGNRILARAVARIRAGRISPLDIGWARLLGLANAVASLIAGLIVEAWDRWGRFGRRWTGWLAG